MYRRSLALENVCSKVQLPEFLFKSLTRNKFQSKNNSLKAASSSRHRRCCRRCRRSCRSCRRRRRGCRRRHGCQPSFQINQASKSFLVSSKSFHFESVQEKFFQLELKPGHETCEAC